MVDDHSFLHVVDMTSRFPVVWILNTESCRSVINVLKGVYCNYGLPKRVITDNGSCFKVVDFVEFQEKLRVLTNSTSTYNHQSVGSVERMVQTVKQIMTRNPENTWLAMLLFFKAIYIPSINKSPGELLNSRKYQTNLPTIDLNQNKSNEPEIEMLVDRCQKVTGTGKELPKLDVGTPVLYDKNTDSSKIKHLKWAKGTVKDGENPRKYHILTDGDRMITRSRCHIKAYMTRSGMVSKAPKCLVEML